MKLTDKQEKVISEVIEDFKSGKVAEKCAFVTFNLPEGIPSAKWTLSNRWLAFLTTGDVDARGFKQWKQVKRYVKKGSRAGYIWRPRIIKVENDEGEKETRCVGFIPVAVFGVSSTDGQPLDYDMPEVPENLPLKEVAESWGIKVKADWFGGAYGSCKVDGSAITMNCTAPKVFFHELAHAADSRVKEARGEKMVAGQDPWQEIVAEFSAEILRRMVGADLEDTSGNTYDYIQHYAAKKNLDVVGAVLKCLRDAGNVVALIMETLNSVTEGACNAA